MGGLTGCPIWGDSSSKECQWGECYCDDWGCYSQYCYAHEDCAIGYYCDYEEWICRRSDTCSYTEECSSGYYCDWRHTCVPDPNIGKSCETNEDCGLSGYCHPSTGQCVGTGRCRRDEDCEEYGNGLICDDRGVCILDPGPCPDGHCGCKEDRECRDGMLCINSLCRSIEEVCLFDFHCDSGETCINNECLKYCTRDEDCPVGYQCEENGVCMIDEDGRGECVYNRDCGVNRFCVNSTCHDGCESDSNCKNGEYCKSGICRADTRRSVRCDNDNPCSGDRVCVSGICRMPCRVDANCATEGEFSKCGNDGYCINPIEENPQCIRKEDCSSRICQNGKCL